MDDDDIQDTGVLGDESAHPAAATSTSTTANPTAATEENAPPKPPRPITEQQKNELILKEAFPSIDLTVIKAVLIASGGQIDPAFNALLGVYNIGPIKRSSFGFNYGKRYERSRCRPERAYARACSSAATPATNWG